MAMSMNSISSPIKHLGRAFIYPHSHFQIDDNRERYNSENVG